MPAVAARCHRESRLANKRDEKAVSAAAESDCGEFRRALVLVCGRRIHAAVLSLGDMRGHRVLRVYGFVETEPPPAWPAAAGSEQKGGGLLFSRLPERRGVILGRVIADARCFIIHFAGIDRDGRA